ncbi:MAG: carboxypeptidase regulatory-like domain-containing protein [Candidatus Omnitrophica bacterium]|nr:carboxypeptidase regulatory-like domain-containing protein [Candidatus Omnitrophota bacterium]
MNMKSVDTILVTGAVLFGILGYAVSAHGESVRITPVQSIGGVQNASECSISGMVVNSQGRPVANAMVTLRGMGKAGLQGTPVTSLTYRTIKVKDGHYSFKQLVPGRYRIAVKEGETGETQMKEITVAKDEAVRVDFTISTLPSFPQ